MEDEGEGKGHVNGNPSSSLTSTVMVNGVLYRFKLRSSESTISAFNVPKSSHYVDLSEYPPGTDIYHELHWDGSRVVAKVPRWAHEKWLRKYQDPDGTITPEDTSPLRDAAAFADGGNGYHPKSASAVPVSERPYIRKAVASLVRRMASDSGPNQGGERPCEDQLNSASVTVSALKRPYEDLVENPSPTAAAADGNHSDGKLPYEDQHRNSASATAVGGGGAAGLNLSASAFPFAYPYVYFVDPGERDYQGRYAYIVEDDVTHYQDRR